MDHADVVRCDLCETALVQLHCDTCLVNLCKACVGEHFTTNLSKPHKIVDFKDKKSTLIFPVCSHHSDRHCESFCRDCDLPLCLECIMFNNLHKEHQLVLIGDIFNLKKRAIQEDFEELEGNILPSYINISTYVQKKYAQISTAITDHAEHWHDVIDRFVNELRAELDEMKTEHLRALRNDSHEIHKEIKNIQDAIHKCENLITSNDVTLALNYTSVNDKYRNLPSTINASFPTFKPVEIETHNLRELFGCVSKVLINSDDDECMMQTTQYATEDESSPSDKQLLNDPETVSTIDTGFERLYHVTCLNDEQIWANGNDCFLKLISVSQGSTLLSVKSRSGNTPEDITVTKNGDLVYTDYKDKTVNIVTNEEIAEVIRLQNWKPRSICRTNSGDFLIIMDSDDYKQSKVVAYSDFTKKYTIQYDETGKPFYSPGCYTKYISENRNLDICVADGGAGAVVVVNQFGKLRFRYTGSASALKNQHFCPRGITTDSQGHILTADLKNQCVHIIDWNGEWLCYIECESSQPWGLCTDENDNLFIAEYENGIVKKIKYLQ